MLTILADSLMIASRQKHQDAFSNPKKRRWSAPAGRRQSNSIWGVREDLF